MHFQCEWRHGQVPERKARRLQPSVYSAALTGGDV